MGNRGAKKIAIGLGLLLMLGQTPLQGQAYKIAPDLQEIARKQPEAQVQVLLVMQDRAAAESLHSSLSLRAAEVPRLLWISRAVAARVPAGELTRLSTVSGLEYIMTDAPAFPDEASPPTPAAPVPNGSEPSLSLIRADKLWKLGYTGAGRKVLVIDTGAETNHPALAGSYRGQQVPDAYAWFDPAGGTSIPNICEDHGLHVLGTIVGLDTATHDTIGVAFGAEWMASPAICAGLTSYILAALQWALDPDGNPATTDDRPDVINNSWRIVDVNNDCISQLYKEAFTTIEEAGIAIVFSAGNSGPDPSTITPPKNLNINLVNTFTVAAINGTDLNLLDISSRGPSACGGSGSLAIKPEVAAPGYLIRSCKPGTGYVRKTGTSMAAPHASGAILLLKEAFPYLPGPVLKLALYQTCTDMGTTGEDNDSGMGLIDVYAAFQYLSGLGYLPAAPPVVYDLSIGPEEMGAQVCGNSLLPSVSVFNTGQQPISQFALHYTLNDVLSGTLTVSDSLLPGASTQVFLPEFQTGPDIYTLNVEAEILQPALTESFLLNNVRKTQGYISGDSSLTDTDILVCAGADALVYAHAPEGDYVRWFSRAEGGATLFQGDSWLIPQVTTPRTVYAGLFHEAAVGKMAPGPDAAYLSLPAARRFDCYWPLTLESVRVYAESEAYVVCTLRDVLGNLKDTAGFWLQKGGQKIDLHFEVQPGRGYLLTVEGSTRLLADGNGNNPSRALPGAISMEEDSADVFFDWAIAYESPCQRAEVQIHVGEGEADAKFSYAPAGAWATPGSVQFQAAESGNTAFFWDFGEGATSLLADPMHTFPQGGDYRVALQVSSASGCSDATEDTVSVKYAITSIGSEEVGLWKIYPNPAQSSLFLEPGPGIFGPVSISLWDIQGRKLLSRTAAPGTYPIEIDLSGLPPGIYLLRYSCAQSEGQCLVNKNQAG